jgi:hypothetical protein
MKKESLNREGQGASCGSTAGDDTSSPELCEQEPPHIVATVTLCIFAMSKEGICL